MPEKKKKLTQKEKKWNAEFKKEMIASGCRQPDKPRLNRKKYTEEALEEWQNREYCSVWEIYLSQAIGIMLGHTDRNFKLTQEAVGAAKILKLAIRLREYEQRVNAEGRKEYTAGELYEEIRDIIKA